MTTDELIATIKCLHKIYYEGDFMDNPKDALLLHRHMEILFDFAEIESSLVENNPNEMSPDDFKKITGIDGNL